MTKKLLTLDGTDCSINYLHDLPSVTCLLSKVMQGSGSGQGVGLTRDYGCLVLKKVWHSVIKPEAMKGYLTLSIQKSNSQPVA